MTATEQGSIGGRSRSEHSTGLRRVVRAEWTKFRTVRAWMIGAVVAVVLAELFAFLVANGSHEGFCTGQSAAAGHCYTGHPFVPTGPDGEAVADSYYFVDRPLDGDGTVTARITSLTGEVSTSPADEAPSLAHTRSGLVGWAKAGLLLTPTTKQGSAYAAVMVTGSHGTQLQYDYTHATPAEQGPVPADSSRWLRLTRHADTVTGYSSTDGRTWHELGSAQLDGLPVTVRVGVFVTSPTTPQGSPSIATASFDHVSLRGDPALGRWRGHSIGTQFPAGASPGDYYPVLGPGGYHRSGASLVVSGSGDIAPAVNLAGGATGASNFLVGLLVALIVLIVITTLFVTSEYRRGLIRTTLVATPRRLRVLAAKAVVAAGVAFVVGAAAAAIALPLGAHLLNKNGNYVFPTTAATTTRVVAGAGALAAAVAIAVLALGVILRSAAGTVTASVAVFALPYIAASTATGSAATWLFRLTPAAGFAILASLPRTPLVAYSYSFANGYYPLPALAGLLVVCGYAAAALAAAAVLLGRRDV